MLLRRALAFGASLTVVTSVLLAPLPVPMPVAEAAMESFQGDFYTYDTIGATAPLTPAESIDPESVSINASGKVAFVAIGSVRESIMVGSGTGDPVTVAGGTTLSYGYGIQINDPGQVAARSRKGGAVPTTLLSLWPSGEGAIVDCAIGGPEDPNINFNHPFSVVNPLMSVNNKGDVVFSAFDHAFNTVLATPKNPCGDRASRRLSDYNYLSLQTPVYPMISDTKQIVVRAGKNATDPIRLYSYDLQSVRAVATSDQFSALGRAPGIDDTGTTIAFYGDLKAGQAAIDDEAGPGIFAHLPGKTGTLPKYVRLAGGTCAEGAVCFQSFSPNSRVAVVHYAVGDREQGIEDDEFLVAFVATPAEGGAYPATKGLWTIRVQVGKNDEGQLVYQPSEPIPVIQVGQELGSKSVIDFELYDPLSKRSSTDHQLAFWVKTNDGELVLRARPHGEITVTNATDVVDGSVQSVEALLENPGPESDPTISLAEAITAVNNSGPGYKIKFAPSLKGATIEMPRDPALKLTVGSTTIDGDVDGDLWPDVILDGFTSSEIDPQYPLTIESKGNKIQNLAFIGLGIKGEKATGNQITGSFIGLNTLGGMRGIQADGVAIWDGASSNTIRGNVIGGTQRGVAIWDGAASNTVRGNKIGINLLGDTVPNRIGVEIGPTASDNKVGGSRKALACTDPCNVISGNTEAGVVIHSGADNAVTGNYIGVDLEGVRAVANGSRGGVVLGEYAYQTMVGGSLSGDECIGNCNVIAGNMGPGVRVEGPATMNAIRGNHIGVGPDGSATFANAYGVHLSGGASSNVVGGGLDGGKTMGNVIKGNTNDGVLVEGANTTANSIRYNRIAANGRLGSTSTRRTVPPMA